MLIEIIRWLDRVVRGQMLHCRVTERRRKTDMMKTDVMRRAGGELSCICGCFQNAVKRRWRWSVRLAVAIGAVGLTACSGDAVLPTEPITPRTYSVSGRLALEDPFGGGYCVPFYLYGDFVPGVDYFGNYTPV